MMKRHPSRTLLVACLVGCLPRLASAACGTSETCSDVSMSLVGQLDVDAITISWSTDAEDSTVAYYQIRRYDCSTPSTCSVDVATVSAIGSCNQNEDYSYEDDPPAPLSSWTYTVEVWRLDGTRACGVDVVPQ